MQRITRNSSCGTLKLTSELACYNCQPNIIRANLLGIEPRRIKKCICPFDEKWANHREIEKVKLYSKIHEYLDNDNNNNDSDELDITDYATDSNEDETH